MAPGRLGMFVGKAKRFGATWQIAQPHSVMFDEEGDGGLAASVKGLLPIYPVTRQALLLGRPEGRAGARSTWSQDVPDPLPDDVRREHGLLDVTAALRWIHGPDDYQQVGAAQKRFRFEEALVTQLVLARRRARLRAQGARARTGRAAACSRRSTSGCRSS